MQRRRRGPDAAVDACCGVGWQTSVDHWASAFTDQQVTETRGRKAEQRVVQQAGQVQSGWILLQSGRSASSKSCCGGIVILVQLVYN